MALRLFSNIFIVTVLVRFCEGWREEIRVQGYEHVLFKKLFENYDSNVRPVFNHSVSLRVYMRLKLYQIFELSEKSQVLTTGVWIQQTWRDQQLTWNPRDYGGIKSLRVPSSRVWLPDTYIYNSASKDGAQGAIFGPYVMLNSNGYIEFPVPLKLKSMCELDVTYFPFDSQLCYIKFASWLHDLQAINLTYRPNPSARGELRNDSMVIFDDKWNIDLSNLKDNSGWTLTEAAFSRREKITHQGIYPEIIFFLRLKRHYMYYLFNVIVPCAMLSCLTCTTNWLPCASGEKVSLGLTCFVAYSVFMLMVAEKVPDSGEAIPILSVYLTAVMSLTSISIIVAVLITNIHEKSKGNGHSRLSKHMRHIFIDNLAKYLGFADAVGKIMYIESSVQQTSLDLFTSLATDLGQLKNKSSVKRCRHEKEKTDKFSKRSNWSPLWRLPSSASGSECRDYDKAHSDLAALVAYEYELLSLVLDTIFFYLYVLLTLVSYFVTLLVIPFFLQRDKEINVNFVP